MNANAQPITKTPDIVLTGDMVEQIMAMLGNGVIFVKTQEGVMRPFVDPIPIGQIIGAAVSQALRNRETPQ